MQISQCRIRNISFLLDRGWVNSSKVEYTHKQHKHRCVCSLTIEIRVSLLAVISVGRENFKTLQEKE